MLDVDPRGLWSVGGRVFNFSLIATELLAAFGFALRIARLSLSKSAAAAVAMTAVSWLFVAVVPLSVVAWAVIYILVRGHPPDLILGPVSWILIVLASALVAAVSGSAILFFLLKHRVTKREFRLLLLANVLCVSLAAGATTVYVIEHPPVAFLSRV